MEYNFGCDFLFRCSVVVMCFSAVFCLGLCFYVATFRSRNCFEDISSRQDFFFAFVLSTFGFFVDVLFRSSFSKRYGSGSNKTPRHWRLFGLFPFPCLSPLCLCYHPFWPCVLSFWRFVGGLSVPLAFLRFSDSLGTLGA